MITDELIRKEFVHHTVKWGISEIYKVQDAVIEKHLNKVSGDLANWSKKGAFEYISSDARDAYYIRVLPYLRFLDINYRRGKDRISMSIRRELSLYNRVVWGIMYGEVSPALRYGMRQDVQNYIRARLELGLSVDTNQVAFLDDF